MSGGDENGDAALSGGFVALDRFLLRDDPAPVAVGLSGGGDSLALLLLAAIWARQARRPLLALTVDHRLNADSATWTGFAAARAAASGAAFQALAWEGDKPRTGLPAAARAARHALLATAARASGARVILLGHTADDVLETERMRAGDAPGIGQLRTWSPSPAWPQGDGVFLLRPMLHITRADLRTWLSGRGETWIDDPANADTRYARVRARLAATQLSSSGATTSDDQAIAALAAASHEIAGGGLMLPRRGLLDAPRPIARRLLSAAVLCVADGVRPPRTTALERLLEGIVADAPAQTIAGARIVTTAKDVRITREAGESRRRSSPQPSSRSRTSDGGSAFRRFRAATFQIADEAQLRTTSSP